MVRAWHHTHGLPTVTINCSNNYGPRQNAEKLVPLLITRALASGRLPLYGDGANVRDWVYVRDACAAIRLALAKGEAGQTYNLGTGIGTSNLEMARWICRLLDGLRPMAGGRPHESLIEFVADRPGHDRRYVVDSTRLRNLTGWKPQETLESGLRKTVVSYLEARGNAPENGLRERGAMR
jgi:dTDP-glucose 4,6-dehydratase